ncbi:MAG: haloacid dehalogenase type II [Gemmatimonadota bacterium]
MAVRPAAVAFDVIETLMPLAPLRDRLAAVGQPPDLLELWFTRTLRDGMALSAAGDFVPFRDVAEAALHSVTGYKLTSELAAQVLAGFGELPAHPDVLPAVQRLAGAGVRVALLTNGGPEVMASFAGRTGLTPYLDKVITTAEVRRWKPPPIVYRYAAESLGVTPERLALVAAHAWDCHGASRAGLVTGWVSRSEGRYPPVFAPPDVTGETLVDVAEGLLSLPEPG